MSGRRVFLDDLPEQMQLSIDPQSQPFSPYGKDPLELFLQLSELAEAEGFHDIYEYIDYQLRNKS